MTKANSFSALLLAAFIVGSGCATHPGDFGINPATTGNLVGFAYKITEDDLSSKEKRIAIHVYEIFSMVANASDRIIEKGITVKAAAHLALDQRFPSPDDASKKELVYKLIRVYWDRTNSKFSIAAKTAKEQLYIISQLRKGIENGLDIGEGYIGRRQILVL